MELINCIKTRRSIRKYKNKEVPDSVIRELIDCARHAPSAFDAQAWEFIVLRDKDVKQKLSDIHAYCSFVKDAPNVIAVCYDKNKLKYSPSDLISPAIAAENLLLAAHNFGLGACWVYVKDFGEPQIEQKAKEILNLPSNIDVLCIIPVGYPDEEPGKRKLRSIEEIIHDEKW